jgi:MFS family permease
MPTEAEVKSGGKKRRSADAGSYTVKEAMRTRAFWMILLSTIIYAYSTQSTQVHLLSHLRFNGFNAATAAAIVTVYGFTQVGGRLVFGWVGDRMGRANMLRFSYMLMAVGWLAAAVISPRTFWVTVPLYYLTYGLGQASYRSVNMTLIADYFGTKRFATIRGVMNPITVGGSLLGPIVAGLMFDHFGSYRLAFFLLCPIVALGAVSMTLAGRSKVEERAAQTAS